ncbi:MAG: tRNA (N6-threonylcarbamoyladenosine(37)-N6)-methyltransferase TrmO [Oscillospiraceae bacterium]|nr:tRNA (N6-threonylcarbamoyladenosine(37)-N6)-methyltransferase TrmO [Oscillospiraceae bacterium]
MELDIIARMHSSFPEKFGIPRQSGIVPQLSSHIVFEPKYRSADALRGLGGEDGFSHIWILWQFSENADSGWSPTVRPPRLGGNKRMGVFATRSPFRPNPIGLSCVKIDRIEMTESMGPVIYVLGADLMDNTPIYDIKPYIPHIDAQRDARGGFSESTALYRLDVNFPESLMKVLPLSLREPLKEVLANGPRPAYHNDPERIYGFPFGNYEIKFKVDGLLLTVVDVQPTA